MQCNLEDDVSSVASTANLLEISEFDVFDAAYREWYHEAPAERLLDRQFGTYLRGGSTPFWVRHFTRVTLDNAPASAPNALETGLITLSLALCLFVHRPSLRRIVDSRTGLRA